MSIAVAQEGDAAPPRAAASDGPALLARAAALLQSQEAVSEEQLAAAGEEVSAFLKAHPADLVALQLLIQIEARRGRLEEAEKHFAQTLAVAPELTEARENYARLLNEIGKVDEASRQLDILLESNPRHPAYLGAKAAALAQTGEHAAAIEFHEAALAEWPDDPNSWVHYGYTLRFAGRPQDSVAAYRKALALQPTLGAAWWGLANLKTFRFEPDDIAAMKALLEGGGVPDEDRFHLHFALGKAFEDQRAYADSFQHYRKGNTIRRAGLHHNPDVMGELVQCMKGLFTPEFLERRKGFGSEAPDPVFVVGLTRSGSTLIEQILASHPAIEGTRELPTLISIVRRLLTGGGTDIAGTYAKIMRALDAPTSTSLGEEYLAACMLNRKTARPFFVDKMPNNFHHLGFIHLILPNAKIVDARRHPLACCFSNFKQLFETTSDSVASAYDLTELGRYYRDYVELMAHFDAVLPGRVHRVFYEQLVSDPENEVRRLLDYCGLPFEESCLRFYETKRSVHTVSSEQVRRPIYKEAVEQWRHYEPWLGPLKKALGPVLTAYPAVPEVW